MPPIPSRSPSAIGAKLSALVVVLGFSPPAKADMLLVENASFENTIGQSVFNEFTFGTPFGWQRYDPSSIIGPGVVLGTLHPNGVDFFNTLAPDGSRVAILFNSARQGDGEYGIQQTLAAALQANTHYELSVEVGNIASGTDTSGTFFDLSEFPGYRIDLLAGGTVIASDTNSLTISEGQFATANVSFTSGATHAQLGQNLAIRLVNLNVIPPGFTQMTSPDLEVDFDRVALQATSAVPEPGSLTLLSLLVLGWSVQRYRLE